MIIKQNNDNNNNNNNNNNNTNGRTYYFQRQVPSCFTPNCSQPIKGANKFNRGKKLEEMTRNL